MNPLISKRKEFPDLHLRAEAEQERVLLEGQFGLPQKVFNGTWRIFYRAFPCRKSVGNAAKASHTIKAPVIGDQRHSIISGRSRNQIIRLAQSATRRNEFPVYGSGLVGGLGKQSQAMKRIQKDSSLERIGKPGRKFGNGNDRNSERVSSVPCKAGRRRASPPGHAFSVKVD